MSYLIIIEPIAAGLSLITKAFNRGLRPIVLTNGDEERQIPNEYLKSIIAVLSVDTENPHAMKKALTSSIDCADILGVVPGFEYFVPNANRLAAQLNLPHLPLETLEALRNKANQKYLLRQQDIPLSKGFKVSLLELIDLAQTGALRDLQYPIVIKPINLSGSIGVRKCSSLACIKSYILATTRGFTDLRLCPTHFLIEEYIEGPEISVEGVVHSDGYIALLSITEKLLGPEPYFVEMGHIVSQQNFSDHRTAIHRYTNQVVRALRITRGVFHVEIRLHPTRGPILMEVGARLPGGSICDLIEFATGIDLVDLQISSFTGAPIAPPSEPATYRVTSGIQFFAGKTGTRVPAINTSLLKAQFPQIIDLTFHLPPKTWIHSSHDYRSRMFQVFFSAPNREEWLILSKGISQAITKLAI